MPQTLIRIVIVFSLVSFIGFTTAASSRAETVEQSLAIVSPYDLINAVNALRSSYGRAPYSINSILMNTAQAQADFMAATGDVTHSGPGGIGLTARLLAAGYPLAGDLSAGGFRAENITSGNEGRTAESVVDGWSGDALHLDTMVSPNLSEIGAGVAIANGRVYFVIDCALPTTAVLPPGATSVPGSGSAFLTPNAPISTAILSTPNSEGDVIHEVQPGQSLWQLAIAYDVKIEDIKRLNNLFDDNIYPGNKLFIRKAVILPTDSITAVARIEPSLTFTTVPVNQAVATSTAIIFTSTEVSSWTSETSKASMPVDDNSILYVTIGIIVLALLGGGVVTWLGSRQKSDNQ